MNYWTRINFHPPLFWKVLVAQGFTSFLKRGVELFWQNTSRVVSVMTRLPSLWASSPAHKHVHGTRQLHTARRKKIIYLCGARHESHRRVKQGLPGLCSGQGSALCVHHLQSKCTWTRTWGFLGNHPIEERHNGAPNYPRCSMLQRNQLHGFLCVSVFMCVCKEECVF